MIFQRPKRTWIRMYLDALQCHTKEEAKQWVKKEVKSLMRKGLDEKGARWLLGSNLAALSFYFTLDERKKIGRLLERTRILL